MAILEIIERLPAGDQVRQIAQVIMSAVMSALENDSEENGLVSLRVIVDLHKTYKSSLQDHV